MRRAWTSIALSILRDKSTKVPQAGVCASRPRLVSGRAREATRQRGRDAREEGESALRRGRRMSLKVCLIGCTVKAGGWTDHKVSTQCRRRIDAMSRVVGARIPGLAGPTHSLRPARRLSRLNLTRAPHRSVPRSVASDASPRLSVSVIVLHPSCPSSVTMCPTSIVPPPLHNFTRHTHLQHISPPPPPRYLSLLSRPFSSRPILLMSYLNTSHLTQTLHHLRTQSQYRHPPTFKLQASGKALLPPSLCFSPPATPCLFVVLHHTTMAILVGHGHIDPPSIMHYGTLRLTVRPVVPTTV